MEDGPCEAARNDDVGSDVDSEDDDACSTDSFTITKVLGMIPPDADEDGRLCYLCKNADKCEEVYDRSDLMDGGDNQKLVLAYERKYMPFPGPPWDEECTYCNGEGCEECICELCDRPMRHINGVNYGCIKHPVV